jgi:peptidyl-prolyl cis-trans isomerase B (cyclophilin B)
VRRVAFLLGALVLAGCGGDGEDESAATITPPPPLETAPSGTGPCRAVEQPGPKPARTLKPPPAILNAEQTFLVTFETSCGDFTVRLDQKRAPKTTASFVALARADFFDGTYFHRIVPNFVIQGGDPTGTGGGGPGYSTLDTPAAGTTYTKGVVAMAKTETEAPGTAGSQFFVVTAQDAGLPPDYAVIGKVVEGMEVVDLIGTLGDPTTEVPTQAVVIEDVVVAVR